MRIAHVKFLHFMCNPKAQTAHILVVDILYKVLTYAVFVDVLYNVLVRFSVQQSNTCNRKFKKFCDNKNSNL